MNNAQDDQSARCWDCGYLLRGVESPQCPECGRSFDRADRTTMNFGRPMGRLGRWALAPVGWTPRLLAIAACVLVWATVRWPVEGWRFSFIDVGYYARFWEWKARVPPASGIDGCYIAGLAVLWLALAYWLVRAAARMIAIARYRPPVFQRGRFWRRTGVAFSILLIAAIGMGIGWPYRLGQRWASEWEKKPAGKVLWSPSFGRDWVGVDQERYQTMLRAAIRFGGTKQKTAGLKLLVEQWNDQTLGILKRAAAEERNPLVKALEIKVLGLSRDASLGGWFNPFLNDPEPQVREAAADAIGIWSQPAFDMPITSNYAPVIDCAPQIHFTPQSLDGSWPYPEQAILGGTRDELEKLMLAGETLGEREAAARSLLVRPPENYRLRYAEWGVFMADSGGNIQFVPAQLDEIPPFVHRIGNPANELAGRVSYPTFIIQKPVIHLTAVQPMVVDLQVCILDGKPWVVYPKMDDLVLTPRSPNQLPFPETDKKFAVVSSEGIPAPDPDPTKPGPFDSLNLPGASALADLREGYPWLTPRHRRHQVWNGRRVPVSNLIGGIGVRWQSIIVSPERLDWMKPADVGPDPRFAWWKRLRDVDCSWISSRGESERFLYYDGPTMRGGLGKVILKNGRLSTVDIDDPLPGLYIEVTSTGIATKWIASRSLHESIEIKDLTYRKLGEEKKLQFLLQSRGLTPSEAAGLVDCWKPAFFQNPGRRFLAFMTADDYDQACPMTIRPQPTDKVRVGIIWTELPP